MKFHTCQGWTRHHRPWKIVGFLIRRKQMTPEPDCVCRIFNFVHGMAQHHGKVMKRRWAGAERRMLNRLKKRI